MAGGWLDGVGSAAISKAAIAITGGKLTGDGIEIACPSMSIEGGSIAEGSTGKASSVVFTGCKELVKETKCKLSSTTITTNSVTADIVSADEVEVAPTTEFVSVMIENQTGKECALDGAYQVTGDLVFEIASANAEAVEHTLTFGKASNLKINSNAATMEGSGKTKLESGADWRICATAEVCGDVLTGAPDPLQFGLVKINKPSKEEFVTYTATKNVKLGTPTFSKDVFTKGANDNCTGQKITANGTCKLGIIFTPTAIQKYVGIVGLIYEIEATKATKESQVLLEGAGE
jgi:hypothetical protein